MKETEGPVVPSLPISYKLDEHLGGLTFLAVEINDSYKAISSSKQLWQVFNGIMMSFVKSTLNPKDQNHLYVSPHHLPTVISGNLDFLRKFSVWLRWYMGNVHHLAAVKKLKGNELLDLLLHGFSLLFLSMGEVRSWTQAMKNEDSSCHPACIPVESWDVTIWKRVRWFFSTMAALWNTHWKL